MLWVDRRRKKIDIDHNCYRDKKTQINVNILACFFIAIKKTQINVNLLALGRSEHRCRQRWAGGCWSTPTGTPCEPQWPGEVRCVHTCVRMIQYCMEKKHPRAPCKAPGATIGRLARRPIVKKIGSCFRYIFYNTFFSIQYSRKLRSRMPSRARTSMGTA